MKRRNTFRAALALLLILTLCMPAAASGFTEKLIAITFDDGPGAYTAQLLDELAARDVKATFFVSGYRAANYPETLKRMVSEGHQLASHTQNHENLNTLSAAKIADEISRTQDYITAAGWRLGLVQRHVSEPGDHTLYSERDEPTDGVECSRI